MQLSNSASFPHLLFYDVWPPPAIPLAPYWERYSDEKLLTLYQTGNAQQSNDAFSAIFVVVRNMLHKKKTKNTPPTPLKRGVKAKTPLLRGVGGGVMNRAF